MSSLPMIFGPGMVRNVQTAHSICAAYCMQQIKSGFTTLQRQVSKISHSKIKKVLRPKKRLSQCVKINIIDYFECRKNISIFISLFPEFTNIVCELFSKNNKTQKLPAVLEGTKYKLYKYSLLQFTSHINIWEVNGKALWAWSTGLYS